MIKSIAKELNLSDTVVTGYEPKTNRLIDAAEAYIDRGELFVDVSMDMGEERNKAYAKNKAISDKLSQEFADALRAELDATQKEIEASREVERAANEQRQELNAHIAHIADLEVERLAKGLNKNNIFYNGFIEHNKQRLIREMSV